MHIEENPEFTLSYYLEFKDTVNDKIREWNHQLSSS